MTTTQPLRRITDTDAKRDLSYKFGSRLQTLMDERGLSQAELGRRAGLSRAVMSNIIRATRNPSLLTAYSLAKALNVKIDDLVPEHIIFNPENQNAKAPNKQKDFIQELERLLNNSKYYSSERKPLTQKNKNTILRLICVYLDTKLDRTPKKNN